MFGVSATLPWIQRWRLVFWFTYRVRFPGARQNLLIVMVWNNGSHKGLVGCMGIVDALDVRIQWDWQLVVTVTFATSQEKTSHDSFRCLLRRTLWTRWKESPVEWEIDWAFEILVHTHANFLALYKRLVTGWCGGQLKSENVLKCLYEYEESKTALISSKITSHSYFKLGKWNSVNR